MHRTISLLVVLPFTSSFSTLPSLAVPTLASRCHGHDAVTLKENLPRTTQSTSSTRIHAYGKGSEIWPECNEEPILLSASFPGGAIPQPAKDLLDSSSATTPSSSSDTSAVDTLSATSSIQTRGRKRRAVRKTLSHILRSAAQASTRRARSTATLENEYVQTFGVPPPAISKGPALLALALLGTNCVNAKHIAAVVGMSVYIIGLASWCAAPKQASTAHNPIVNMPSLPSKGHVPNLITNPLGASLTNSRVYRTWLRVGALLGLLLPAVILAQLTLGSRYPAAMATINVSNVREVKRILGGPMFLLCCQALTEAVARMALLPLPIRILIPVSYNTLRLSSLQSWAFPAAVSSIIPKPLQALGVVNLVYWYANLFLFLVPVGVTRYLRAHFYCVEAVEVTVRKGGEGSVGLLP
mmetsp:Transcript_25264/g.54394  ORF Transcript_25264/g.54394 Transcript_25264/m.54394 type:complete len:412 (+) Transcript_25264:154-1389(+)|eukprot:CAMPEP_0172326562 /NCGR_PEP_ID=MMETSP1058-20130122/56899_1 /TAXON_ID=83371 /ORGANISM="Detonula confervacea, Strain CCMP 353" /LENGTH=411 /DNA_ID=CAMNT_0013043375 /DNA_START=59 /DNA_END=1294 /DNA_ORIENTATION=-